MTPPNLPDDALAPDPHLRRMLAHAPDAEAQPAPATRAAILAAAHRAVAVEPGPVAPPVTPAPGVSALLLHWLDRLLPRPSMAWSAALATVVLATFITLMWHNEPIPQAQPDGDPASVLRRAPMADAPMVSPAPPQAPVAVAPVAPAEPLAPSVAAAPSEAPAPSAPSAPFAVPAPPSVAEAVRPAEAERRASAKTEALRAPPGADALPPVQPQARARASSPLEAAGAGASAADHVAEAADASAAPAARAAAVRPPLAAQAPPRAQTQPPLEAAQAERSAAASPPGLAAPPAPPARAPAAAAPAPAPAPPAAAPAPAAARAPEPFPVQRVELAPAPSVGAAAGASHLQEPQAQAPAAAPRRLEPWQHWTQVRLAGVQGQALTLDRARAQDLTALLSAVLPAADAPARDAALPAAVDGRLTLLQDGRSLGTLEMGGSGLRWHAAGAAPVFAEPPPAALQALRAWLAQAPDRAVR